MSHTRPAAARLLRSEERRALGLPPDQQAALRRRDGVAKAHGDQAGRGRQGERPPAAHRRAEGLLLPGGLALRRRPQRPRRDRRLPPHRRVHLPEPRRAHRHHDARWTPTSRTRSSSRRFWLDEDDQPLAAYREITTDEIDARRGAARTRRWRSGCAAATTRGCCKQVRFYCEELERAGKYQLYLWPPHCLLGSDGHALAGVVHEARLFHAFARGAQSCVEVKGGNPLTENYSVLRPEVLTRYDGAAARAAQHAVPPRRCSTPTRWSSPARPRATA